MLADKKVPPGIDFADQGKAKIEKIVNRGIKGFSESLGGFFMSVAEISIDDYNFRHNAKISNGRLKEDYQIHNPAQIPNYLA